MGYMLPLRFINVSRSPKVSICATRIVSMMSTEGHQARKTIADEKKKGTLINACGKNAAKTAIFLDNGSVISSPYTIPILLNALEKSNAKPTLKNNVRLRVYDVSDEEPNPDIDEEDPDLGGYADD
jgi:regulator of extracellular matrix RemA (YlzA/DUF370 family)